MKRSEVNDIIREADQFMRSFGFLLPPFAYYSVDDMQRRRTEIDAIVEARLGWDITDYGVGDFDKTGLFLFTLRNGSLEDLKHGMGMCYAEKIMISRKDQLCPMHRHMVKTEDIINRGGARLAIKMYGSGPDGGRDPDARVTVLSDGIARTVAGGDVLLLEPGESVTLRPGDWHAFWGEGGDTLVGEVSTVNDDRTDNVFSEPIGRFSEIEEDEDPLHLLVSDYENWLTDQ
ncbi:MAG: D-lyxose/D-mannose family sugar isomerase [Rhodospirillales bacterium]|nr:MAG: D-lyxose/D-mannose family sugar isomerase [Rhodospirillales bacterium]